MAGYDFASLSPYDFECLVRDLLQKDLNITLESFTVGRDNGIDLRYSRTEDDQLIIQVKHYANSGFRVLLNQLKLKELSKVEQLDPSSYILATSIGLTPLNKDKIKNIFSKYIQSTGDIYGRDDINNLLGKYPEIEKHTFKLWLTSQAVLERLLHSSIFNQSDLEIENIKKKMRYYVENESLIKAKEILDGAHYCIITGISGIGKTTLAEILIIRYLDMDYELIKISEDISEAYEAYNPKAKQIFYYDDFLGQTSLEEKLSKNEDQRLITFLESVKKSPNTRFILTTRDYILNIAKSTYERLDRSCFDIHKYIINLSSYTRFDRAKMLFNHVYFSNLSQDYRNALLKDEGYLKIIEHKNFNPRIIEGMTEYIGTLGITSESYLEEFLGNLNRPKRLWEHAFENQISNASKNLLLTLASMPDGAPIIDLEQAFMSAHRYKSEVYSFPINSSDFKKSLRELNGNFIRIDKWGSNNTVSFHNPSIKDFIEDYLARNHLELANLCDSAEFFDQCIILSKYIKQLDINRYIDKLQQTINTRQCSFFYSYKAGSAICTDRKDFSIESRILFLLKLYKNHSDCRILDLACQMIDALIKSLDSNIGNKDDILKVASVFSSMNLKYNEIQFYRAIKLCFTRNLDSLGDFNYIVRLSKINSNLLSDDEIEILRDEFNDYYSYFIGELKISYIRDGTSVVEPDPEMIRESSKVLESIGDFFQFGTEVGVERLEYAANEIEKAMQDPEEDTEWKFKEAIDDKDQIESLFDLLKDSTA